MIDFLTNGPEQAETCILLAHGAGAPMDSPFMTFFAEGLAARGHRVLRFEFPYMARRRAEGGKRPPDREPVLLETWRQAVFEARDLHPRCRMFIGGKSMGARMASLVAGDVRAGGLIGLGYPFYPAGKAGWSEKRLGHLRGIATPSLICQGERDPLGARAEVEKMPLSPAVRLVWLPDGDHSLKPRKASGHTERGNLEAALWAVAEFVER